MVYCVQPNYSILKSFGCLYFAARLNVHDKFLPRSTKCVVLEYAKLKKAYKVYDLESDMLFHSRDVKFFENIFPFKLNNSSNADIPSVAQRFIKTFLSVVI